MYLAPGTYRYQVGLDGTYNYGPELEKAETITVDEKTPALKLKLPDDRTPDHPTPHRIEIMRPHPLLYGLDPRT